MTHRISEGSGIDSGKLCRVIPWNDPRTETIRREYPFVGGRTPQSMRWVAVITNDGILTSVPKSRLLTIGGN